MLMKTKTKRKICGIEDLDEKTQKWIKYRAAWNKKRNNVRAGMCFVDWTYRRTTPDGNIQKLHDVKKMTLKRALNEKRRILRCYYCNEPATHKDN